MKKNNLLSGNGKHRVATTLELFYDLAIVLAIAAASVPFHHALAENHIADGILHFSMAFFALWWAWVNFTWYSSVYDTDDAIYKVSVFVKITGALIFAAGVPGFFSNNNLTLVLIGFCVMRLALLNMWLRVAINHAEDRSSAMRNVIGIAFCQIGWIILVLVLNDRLFLIGFLVMIIAELFVPYYSRKVSRASFHIEHINERHGLLAIIALGECLLSITRGVSALWNHFNFSLLSALAGSLLVAYSMWGLYFGTNDLYLLRSRRGSFVWGYLHYSVYLSIAATGAGISVIWDQLTDHTSISLLLAQATIAVPLALFLLTVWLLREAFSPRPLYNRGIIPVFAAIIIALIFVPNSLIMIGVTMQLLVLVRGKFSARASI